ncbi:uncharacterized protein LOC135225001 isoform X2 [Macrobrachium nipponense]|uniref:uncharacterized protein LOC135225001 isoform X2 n=1 Tax=Macrobrachium nipponense TaxID=159736 RepID=UPI0030C875BA
MNHSMKTIYLVVIVSIMVNGRQSLAWEGTDGTNEAADDVKEVAGSRSEESLLDKRPAGTGSSQQQEPMTKNQISIPVGDGSMVGMAGTVLVSAFFGLALWLGLISHLGTQKAFRMRRRNSMVGGLANSVERGVRQQTQELEVVKQGSYLHIGKQPDLQQRVQVFQSQPQGQQGELGMSPSKTSHLKVPTKTMKGIASFLVPEDSPRQHHPHQEGSAAFGQTIEKSHSSKSIHFKDENVRKDSVSVPATNSWKQYSSNHHTLHLSVPPEIDYNSYQTRPFSLPGSFVNPDRKGYQNDDVTYYFEVPSLTPRLPNRPKPIVAQEKDVTYYYETIPILITNPVIPSKDNMMNSFEKNQGLRNTGARRPIAHSAKGESVLGSLIASPNLQLTNRQQYTSEDTKGTYSYPPSGLLNPKPNKWRSSTKSYLSDIPPYTWNWRRVSEGYQHSSTKDPKYPERETRKKPELNGSSSKFFPPMILPKNTSKEISTQSVTVTYPTTTTTIKATTSTAMQTTMAKETFPQQDDESSSSSRPAGTSDYDDIIAVKLSNGVPVNWMPDTQLAGEDDENQDYAKEKKTKK